MHIANEILHVCYDKLHTWITENCFFFFFSSLSTSNSHKFYSLWYLYFMILKTIVEYRSTGSDSSLHFSKYQYLFNEEFSIT
jgi:hypothetical protein